MSGAPPAPAAPPGPAPAGPERPVRVLALDGGGVRGLIIVRTLIALEAALQAAARRRGRTAGGLLRYFDLLAGSSTGGLVAMALATPREPGGREPLWPLEAVLDFYRHQSVHAFRRARNAWMQLLWRPLIDHGPFEAVLEELLGERRLAGIEVPLLMPSYDLRGGSARFFRSHAARESPAEDLPLTLVARAITAAPVFYGPVRVERPDGSGVEKLVDGALFASNPALLAYTEAHRLFGRERPVVVVSIGTGQLQRSAPEGDLRRRGLLRWLWSEGRIPLLEAMMDGQVDCADMHLADLLGRGRGYFRFDPPLPAAHAGTADVSRGNLRGLDAVADALIEGEAQTLAAAAEALVDAEADDTREQGARG